MEEIESSNEPEPSFERILIQSENEEEDIDDANDAVVSDSDISDEDEDIQNGGEVDTWLETISIPPKLPYKDEHGLNKEATANCIEPIDFYELFVDDQLIQFIVNETNRYAIKQDPTWHSTDVVELKKFFALSLQMAIVKLPTLRDYWSKDPVFGQRNIGSSVMSRNRFENLMKFIHLSDNEAADKTNRLYKISEFMNRFTQKCKLMYRPTKEVCIDESLVPFRGRIIFRQYIPNKTHRYGIKVFKLCCSGGYTYNMTIYAGKESTPRNGSVASDTVMFLINDLLDCGRTLYTDNWYTSISLAKKLLARKTNLVGTLGKNRRGIPNIISTSKLKRGEHIARQTTQGITILKWKDKRDVLMLSTMHDDSRSDGGKPVAIVDYNSGKIFVDISDQMTAYTPFIRKTTKWYKRILFHMICQLAVVNAWCLYKIKNGVNIQITEFRKCIVRSWLGLQQVQTPVSTSHILEKFDGPNRKIRRRCKACYAEISHKFGHTIAVNRTKTVNTRCSKCLGYYCLPCFQLKHKKC